MTWVNGFVSKLRQKDFLWWSLAAVLGLGAVSLSEFITSAATGGRGWFTLGELGLFIVGALLSFCKPGRAWRWGLGSVFLFPVSELVTTRGEISYVIVKLPIYALQALPALLGAYLGALARVGGVPTAGRLSEGARSARVWVLGFLLGALTGWMPRLLVGDPSDQKISYFLWWGGLFLSALVVGYLRPERPAWSGVTVGLGFTSGITAECVGYSPCNLLPIVMLFAIFGGVLPTFLGAYFGKFVALKLAKRRKAETETSPGGSRYVGMILNTGIALSLFGVLLFIASTPKSGEELRRAAIKGDVETVKSLLTKGANINWRAGGWTILMSVAREGHTEVAKILLENGADVNARGVEGGQWGGATALTIAAERGHAEMAKLLLAHGADVNAKNDHGNTALMYGAEYGHPEVVKVLLAPGADVTPKDKDGETALMMARRRGYSEIIQLFKNAGARE